MGRLTTHVLDTAHGRPAEGVRIALHRREPDGRLLCVAATNADGRCDRPLLEGDTLLAGTYEMVFDVGDYFEALGVAQDLPRFLDQVVLRFGIADPAQHYHVPLLASPFAYSTYRGS